MRPRLAPRSRGIAHSPLIEVSIEGYTADRAA
jgi:hypothetical protein